MGTQASSFIHVLIERANEELKGARLLLAQGLPRLSLSRCYYAVFNAASAALLTQGIARSKHSAIEAAFNQFLIKPGILEPEWADIYRQSRKVREEADYGSVISYDQAQAECMLADAERFVARIETYLRQAGATLL